MFSIQGDCDLSDGGAGGGTAEFEIARAGTAGTDYDELVVSGATTLGGTLRLVLLSGYTPRVGDVFNLIQSGSVTGSFAQIDSPSLKVSQTPSATGLRVTVTGIQSDSAPVFTSGGAPNAYPGTPFDFAVTASNDPAGFAATGLPAGLSIDAVTGRIYGTPTTGGIYTASISATNASGTGTQLLSVAVVSPLFPHQPPTITSLTSANAQAGVAFTYQIDASGSPTSFSATFAGGPLPPGLSFDGNGGLIYGIPAEEGSFAIGISATNADGTSPTTPLNLTVSAAPNPTPAPTPNPTPTPTPAPSGSLPVATLSVTTPTVTAGSGGVAAFRVTLSAAQSAPLTVAYTIKGAAANGVDYELLTGKKKFKPGKTSKPILIVPMGDLGGAPEKTVKLALAAGTGYTVGSAAPLKVKILAP